MDKVETAHHLAVQAFNGLGYMPTRERLSHSILATAWATGFPKPTLESHMEADNPWAAIPIEYHLEEAIVYRFWAMQAELLFGYLTKIMEMAEDELGLPIRAERLQPIHVLRGMTQLLLDRAQRRANTVGSPGSMTSDQVVAMYNAHVLQYEAMVSAAVRDSSPFPTDGFQLGVSRLHPWTALIAYCSDNLCSRIPLEPQIKPLASKLFELATSQTQTGLFSAIQRLL